MGILNEFPSKFDNLKGRAQELRRILFPSVSDGIYTGTPPQPERLYDSMIAAFERAIAGEEAIAGL
jgi:hypothetical protein